MHISLIDLFERSRRKKTPKLTNEIDELKGIILNTPGRWTSITVAAASSFLSDLGWKSSCERLADFCGRVAVTPPDRCLIAISVA
jgi:hypothetical protein